MEAAAISNDNGSSNFNKKPPDLISAVPVDCLNRVMQRTSPLDACRAAAVCTSFRSVVESDDLWKHFLPADLSLTLSCAETDIHQQLPLKRKELYCYLCHNWIRLDGGIKSFSLDFKSGAKKILLHEGSLKIFDSRHTNRPILLTRGTIDVKDLSPMTNYAAYLVFTGTMYSGGPQVRRRLQNNEEVELLVQLWRNVYELSERSNRYGSSSGSSGSIFKVCPKGLWHESEMIEDGRWEIKLGNFNTCFVTDKVSVYFSDYKLQECDLIVQAVEVRPEID